MTKVVEILESGCYEIGPVPLFLDDVLVGEKWTVRYRGKTWPKPPEVGREIRWSSKKYTRTYLHDEVGAEINPIGIQILGSQMMFLLPIPSFN